MRLQSSHPLGHPGRLAFPAPGNNECGTSRKPHTKCMTIYTKNRSKRKPVLHGPVIECPNCSESTPLCVYKHGLEWDYGLSNSLKVRCSRCFGLLGEYELPTINPIASTGTQPADSEEVSVDGD